MIISIIFFGADATLLAYAQTKGVLLAIYVLYIVWMALVLYNVVQETGANDYGPKRHDVFAIFSRAP